MDIKVLITHTKSIFIAIILSVLPFIGRTDSFGEILFLVAFSAVMLCNIKKIMPEA